MNFKKFHVSRNLFDEANLEGGIYLAANGNKYGSITNGVRSGVKINVLPDTSYTLSLYSNANIAIRILQWSGETFITNSVRYNVSGNVSLTVTTNSATDKIAFNVEGVNGQYAENLMLNEGSTPLPYEPYSSEVWHDIPHYIHNTSTDTITTPADIYANDTTATVGLKGNMEQSGTPTPTTPIQPQSCGERTAQLFDKSAAELTGYNLSGTTFTPTAGTCHIDYKLPSGTYTISCDNDKTLYIRNGKVASGYISQKTSEQASATFTYDASVDGYLRISSFGATVSNIMLNSGSQPLPYENFGYKIPILNNSQTTNVYLGEVESTRQIKKLVLTGEETYTSDPSYSRFIMVFPNAKIEGLRLTPVYCTHFISVYDGRPVSEVPNNSIYSSDRFENKFFIKTTDYTTDTDFKAYLAQQYAAGTPVTVWYVRATPITGIVNEPLMKIGDYADEVTGISIPVTAGANTIDVDTTLQPSEVSVNYHGWHPVADVHERENGAWT